MFALKSECERDMHTTDIYSYCLGYALPNERENYARMLCLRRTNRIIIELAFAKKTANRTPQFVRTFGCVDIRRTCGCRTRQKYQLVARSVLQPLLSLTFVECQITWRNVRSNRVKKNTSFDIGSFT